MEDAKSSLKEISGDHNFEIITGYTENTYKYIHFYIDAICSDCGMCITYYNPYGSVKIWEYKNRSQIYKKLIPCNEYKMVQALE